MKRISQKQVIAYIKQRNPKLITSTFSRLLREAQVDMPFMMGQVKSMGPVLGRELTFGARADRSIFEYLTLRLERGVNRAGVRALIDSCGGQRLTGLYRANETVELNPVVALSVLAKSLRKEQSKIEKSDLGVLKEIIAALSDDALLEMNKLLASTISSRLGRSKNKSKKSKTFMQDLKEL